MKKIVIIGHFNTKELNAAGKRVLGIAESLKKDYEIILIGCQNDNRFTGLIDYDINVRCAYYPSPSSIVSRLRYREYYNYIVSILKTLNDVECIISYGSPTISLLVKKLMHWCDEHSVTFISDCVDMIFKTGKGGVTDIIKWADTYYLKNILIPKSKGIIAISNNIRDYYLSKGCKNIIVIPPITKRILGSASSNDKKTDRVIVSYAGVPFNKVKNIPKRLMKDRLDIAINYVCALIDRGIPIQMNVYGITKEEYLFSVPYDKNKKYFDKYIVFWGKVDNSLVSKAITESDFCILCRDKTVITENGFPTKFTESLSLGTPVITTNTSDIGAYLVDGKNGILVDYLVDDVSLNKLETILSDYRQRCDMKEYCKSEYPFDPLLFSDKLNHFLNNINTIRTN